jgi:small ligand-binding sensory domain FIST
MWAAGAGFSIDPDGRVAAREAAQQARAAAGGADAALLFAGPSHRGDASGLVAAACAELGTRRVAGGLAHGVIGAGREQEGGAGVSVLAVHGLAAETLWVPSLAGNEDVAAEELAARLAGGARAEDLVVLIPDPRALQPDLLLARIRDAVDRPAWSGRALVIPSPRRRWCGAAPRSTAGRWPGWCCAAHVRCGSASPRRAGR